MGMDAQRKLAKEIIKKKPNKAKNGKPKPKSVCYYCMT
jgi:hypothetical protein